jgi:hypothetical protein
MSSFQVVDEKRYPLRVKDLTDNVDLLDFYRWEHRVTVSRNFSKYMVFIDNLKNVLYVEEITNGIPEQIEDDSLWEAIHNWTERKGFLNVMPPLPKPPGYSKCKVNAMSPAIKI